MAMEKGFEKESHFGRILRPASIVSYKRIPRAVAGGVLAPMMGHAQGACG
jgi:hypothetical protein